MKWYDLPSVAGPCLVCGSANECGLMTDATRLRARDRDLPICEPCHEVVTQPVEVARSIADLRRRVEALERGRTAS